MRITEAKLRRIIREEKRLLTEGEYEVLEQIDDEIQRHLELKFERVDGGSMSYPFGRNRGDELEYQTWIPTSGDTIGRKIVALVDRYNYMKAQISGLGFMGSYQYRPLSASDTELKRTWRKHSAG